MTAILLEPHPDDATLFAAFTCYRWKPLVVTVLRADLQERRGLGITAATRRNEQEGAMMILGCEWEQLQFSEAAPDWEGVHRCVAEIADRGFDRCYAPEHLLDGHDHHNMVAMVAKHVFGAENVLHYTTYGRGNGRSVGDTPVAPVTGALAAKLAALACYESQINEPSTQPWFMGPFQEWYA